MKTHRAATNPLRMASATEADCSPFLSTASGTQEGASRATSDSLRKGVAHMKSRVKGESGSIFVFSIIALTVLLVLGAASLQIAMQSTYRATKEQRAAVAFNLSEAAADAAESWLRAQSAPPSGTSWIDPLGGTKTFASGTYSAVIQPDPGNPTSWQKAYTIEATGTSAKGNLTSRVILRVQEQSFGRYAYFTDYEQSSISGGVIWFYAGDRLYGPTHTNDQFHVVWDTGATSPIFYDTVSSHSGSVSWNPRAPRNANEWRKVLQGGQPALKLGVDSILLPSSTDVQKAAAWGADSGFPSSNGVYVPNTGSQPIGGVYIRGDSTVQLSVEAGTGNQKITVVQGSTTTTITVNLSGNQTTVADATPGSPHTYTGVPNGAIYSTGNITSLQGTLADNYQNGSAIVEPNAWTIATDVVNHKNITLTNNLRYQTQPDATKPATDLCNLKAATLGLVAENVIVGSACPNDMTINGVILAGYENSTNGSFYNATWNTTLKAYLHVLGGVIQKKRGPVGQISGTTLVSGYSKDYHYDPRLAIAPPPFYPTTGQYDVVSWQHKG